ncbi:hypothetical protein BCV70DRAFT_3663 [Testicularia cyperi]|uniref:Uncharacterized protein n=1 Tax=Testicularia cyperi TaxID=1882483 RepID=A0A317XWF2_9BASI|nr:hypothetical protein BCV70DRAFT_3663 [Testicularia cyperi]
MKPHQTAVHLSTGEVSREGGRGRREQGKSTRCCLEMCSFTAEEICYPCNGRASGRLKCEEYVRVSESAFVCVYVCMWFGSACIEPRTAVRQELTVGGRVKWLRRIACVLTTEPHLHLGKRSFLASAVLCSYLLLHTTDDRFGRGQYPQRPARLKCK